MLFRSDLSFIASFDEASRVDQYTKIIMRYPRAEATLKAGAGVKAEDDLVVAGTRGYVYAPAPWWKMDYFKIRKEDPRDNRRYFYQFEGDAFRRANENARAQMQPRDGRQARFCKSVIRSGYIRNL